MIMQLQKPPASAGTVGLTSNEYWRFRTGYELKLSESLAFELESNQPQNEGAVKPIAHSKCTTNRVKAALRFTSCNTT